MKPAIDRRWKGKDRTAGVLIGLVLFSAVLSLHASQADAVGPVGLTSATGWGTGHGGSDQLLVGNFFKPSGSSGADNKSDVVQVTPGHVYGWASNGSSFSQLSRA